MEDLKTVLLQLQRLDDDIERARLKLKEFEPQFAEIEGPVTTLETEVAATRTRLDDLRGQVRRLETGAEQKRQRLRVYEERMSRIRNMREESASRVEMDLIRRAADADDSDALEMMEQATRTDLKLDELIRNLEKTRAETAPKRDELERSKAEAAAEVQILVDRRQNHTVRLEPAALRLYERVRQGRSTTVLAPLTPEGACGHCFSILPLQEQSMIRNATSLHRCETCGVILYIEE
jgi:predicted  nucleic acid-binding Zn-ribbon protein